LLEDPNLLYILFSQIITGEGRRALGNLFSQQVTNNERERGKERERERKPVSSSMSFFLLV
jgi:hypothetical protein